MKTLGIVITINLLLLIAFYKKCKLDVNLVKFYHNISTLIIPFVGIYFTLFISKLLAPIVKNNSLLDKVGKNSLHIMANHIFIIFLIELVILIFDGHSLNALPHKKLNNLFYNMPKYKYLYTFLSIIICTYIGEALHMTGQYIKSRFNKKSTVKLFVQSDDVQALPSK